MNDELDTTRPDPTPCCPPTEQSSCCGAEDKAACCGATATAGGGCGCR